MLKYLILTISLAVSSTAMGASFDCAKANTNVEKLICKDKELSELDVSLNDIYSLVIKASKDPSSQRREQINWLRQKRDKCENDHCLVQVYTERILHLINNSSDTQAPPPNIFGTFSNKHEICLKGAGDGWDCGNAVTDTVSIIPGSQGTVSVVLDLTFENGHICRLDRTGRWGDGIVILPLVWGEKIYICKLGVSATDGEITISDRGSCTEQSCGARGGLYNIKLKRNR